MPDELYNFAKKKPEEINSLGDPYDYHSIMHYAKALFAKPGKSETIRPTDPKAIIGQVAKLSSSDVRQTNLLYDCPSCGQTLMQSSGTFSSPQVQTPLTGKSYESGRLQKSELNILIRPSPQHTFADNWQARKTVSVASEAKASNRSLPANLPQVSSATPSSLICRWRIVAENHEKISLHFKHMEMPSPVNSHLSGKQQQTDGQPLTGVPQECTDEHIEVATAEQVFHRRCCLRGPECGSSTNVQQDRQVVDLWPITKLELQSECILDYLEIYDGSSINSPLIESSVEGIPQPLELQSECILDYLEIYDGSSINSPLIQKLCGGNIPQPVRSTDNTMYVKFVSDDSVQEGGFSAWFQKERKQCNTAKHGCQHTCLDTPDGYKCKCKNGYELQEVCRKNFARVLSGPQNNRRRKGTFCGSKRPPPIISHTNELTMDFHVDGSIQPVGFRATYLMDRDECADSNGGCEQICRNTIGSYFCKCRSGFKLHERFKCIEPPVYNTGV
ncbi:Bone morphoproteintic protein 1 [Sparganum proliferum]